MKPQRTKALVALSVFLSFTFSQVYVHAALPEPAPAGGVPQQITARLTTRNNQPITVNGNAASTGDTILTGATIETPDQVGATIDLGDAGVVELEPNSKIQIDFDINGNVRVKVLRGCAVARKRSNVLPGEMELYSDQDSLKTDKKRRNVAGCLLLNGQLGPAPGVAAAVPATGTGINPGLLGAVAAFTGAAIAGGIAFERGETTSGVLPD